MEVHGNEGHWGGVMGGVKSNRVVGKADGSVPDVDVHSGALMRGVKERDADPVAEHPPGPELSQVPRQKNISRAKDHSRVILEQTWNLTDIPSPISFETFQPFLHHIPAKCIYLDIGSPPSLNQTKKEFPFLSTRKVYFLTDSISCRACRT